MASSDGGPPKGKPSFAKTKAGPSAEALAKAGKLSGSVTEGAVLQGFAAGCLLDAEII